MLAAPGDARKKSSGWHYLIDLPISGACERGHGTRIPNGLMAGPRAQLSSGRVSLSQGAVHDVKKLTTPNWVPDGDT